MRKLTVEEIDTRIAWFRQTNNADMVEFLNMVREHFARPEVDAQALQNEMDAARYRFLKTTSCGNAEGGKGSDDECYLSLTPEDMDATIDSNLRHLPQSSRSNET